MKILLKKVTFLYNRQMTTDVNESDDGGVEADGRTEIRWQQYLNHVLQQLGHQLSGSGENGWYPLSDDPSTCCKLRKGGNSIDVKVTSGNTHLIPEYTRQTTDGIQVVFAPNYIGTPNLSDCFDQLTLEERLQILADAMDGCNHLHSQGFIHGDVNPTNILVKTENDNSKTGLLGDLECITKEGGIQTGGFGTYHENMYFNNFSISENADRKIDLFTFGLLLLACYIGISRISTAEQHLDQTDTQARSVRFNQWLEIQLSMSEIPTKIKETVRNLLSSQREIRPNLNEVITVLREYTKV